MILARQLQALREKAGMNCEQAADANLGRRTGLNATQEMLSGDIWVRVRLFRTYQSCGSGPAASQSSATSSSTCAVLIWSRLHGIVSLEIARNFASMGIDPGQFFEVQLAALTT